MRASRRAVRIGAGMVMAMAACASPPREREQAAPIVTAFSEGTSAGAQARRAQARAVRTDLEECRRMRQQGVYPRERNFPCEAFLGE